MLAAAFAAAAGYLFRGTLLAELGGEPTRATHMAARLAEGDYSAGVAEDARPGSVLGSLAALRRRLQEHSTREQAAAAEAGRIRKGLDVVATNVMVADADCNVVYVNHSIRKMLEEAESDLRKALPGFSAKDVLGGNIDRFHKNPAHQRGLLARLSSSYDTRLEIGGRAFSLIVNPIIDDKGARLGYVVEWKDLTAERAAARREEERQAELKRVADENLRIRNALDNVSTNVMIANNEREIIYLNHSIVEMLAKADADIRKDLSQFDARRLMGTSIDLFHRNPEHQKRMLAELRGTHRTQIKVGGRTFKLTVNPIQNTTGERLGTVVEWLDRTAEVAVEEEIGDIVEAAAQGDFSRRVALDDKEGFFRLLAEKVNELLETSATGLGEIAGLLQSLANGDLTRRITAELKGTFGKLKEDGNSTVEQLAGIVAQIKSASESINSGAREIVAGNSDISGRIEQLAANLQQTASSMEELTGTVKQNAENAKQANQLAIGANNTAVNGGQVVSAVVETMDAINQASRKIVDIISVIDGIAFQTNILALNAAVEAARAGEQGRGFAVVAAEVRSLAQRSAGAAKEIKGLIGDSVEKVGNGMSLVQKAGTTMEEIVVSVKRVTDIMGEITVASQEQSAGINTVSQTITQIDQVTQQNATLVEQASAAARSMEEQAMHLSGSVSRFTLAQGGIALPPAVTTQPRPAIRTNGKGNGAPPRPKAPPPAGKPDEWSEF
ncbi:MAG: methyl-accepting chemotaxis protein [Nevskia sp.]|nr:methyl-accepting chemotaxis protein [Nevskia sp.]